MTHDNTLPGRLLIMAAGIFLTLAWGCTGKRLPLTQQLLDSGISFEQIPGGMDELNTYAESPSHNKAIQK